MGSLRNLLILHHLVSQEGQFKPSWESVERSESAKAAFFSLLLLRALGPNKKRLKTIRKHQSVRSERLVSVLDMSQSEAKFFGKLPL